MTIVFGRHLPAVLRCLSTRLSAQSKAAQNLASLPHRRFKRTPPPPPTSSLPPEMAEPITPENRGLPPKGKFPSGK